MSSYGREEKLALLRMSDSSMPLLGTGKALWFRDSTALYSREENEARNDQLLKESR